ncbi:MAG: DegT/DnrJ/EryC1/StrS family aminotransferase [Thermoleophilia bacterium]
MAEISSPWRIALADVSLSDDDRAAVMAVLDSGWLSMGPVTAQFEDDLRIFLGTDQALAVTNGTAALHLAAAALGLGPGDEVICPSLTFVASAAAMRQTGATVRLADVISTSDFSLDPNEVTRLVNAKTKAIVVMHYGGYPSPMGELLTIARENGLFVIEDAAHAPGATLDGVALGSIGDAGCFSFFANKNMTTGEGGAVVFRRKEHADRARLLRSHAMTTLTWDRHRGHATSYDVLDVGFNYRIDEIRAALGVSQLAKVPAFNAARKTLADRYRSRLADHEGLDVPFEDARGEPSFHLAPILARTPSARDAIREALRIERIQTSVHYPPIHRFSSYPGAGALPVTESIADRVLTLPLHPGLSLETVDEICDLLFGLVGADGAVG